MTDEDIIALYWARKEQAIRESDAKYGKYCHTIAWNILANREDCEECVSDTWLSAWNAIPPQRPALLKAFLGKITRNLALNRYEKAHAAKRGNGQTAVCLEELAECLSDDRRPEEHLEAQELTACLNRFLEGLKPEERMLFVRRYWYLDSVGEIARRYRLGESKVKMSLLRTRGKLREALTREGFTV